MLDLGAIRDRLRASRMRQAAEQQQLATEQAAAQLEEKAALREKVQAEKQKALKERLKSGPGARQGKAKPILSPPSPINTENPTASLGQGLNLEQPMATNNFGQAGGPQPGAPQQPAGGVPMGGGMSVPPLITRQATTRDVGLQNIGAGASAFLPSTRTTTTTEPNVLTPYQAISAQLQMREMMQKRRDTEMDLIATALLDSDQASNPAIFNKLLEMSPQERQELEVRHAALRTKTMIEQSKAASTIGKLVSDFNKGLITHDQLQIGLEAVRSGNATTIHNYMPGSQTELEKRIIDTAEARDRMIRIQNALDRSFAGAEGQLTAWGLEKKARLGGIPIVGDAIGLFTGGKELTPEQRQWKAGYDRMMVRAADDLNLTLRAFSGVAVSPAEAERLEKVLIKSGESFETMENKIGEKMLAINMGLVKHKLWEMSRGNEDAPEQAWFISDTKAARTLSNAIQTKAEQLAAANPGTPESVIVREAISRVEDTFGLSPGAYQLILNEYRGFME